MFEAPAFDGFAGRTHLQQALTVFGGVVACSVGFLGAVVLVFGDLSMLADGGWVRRIALAGASVTCWSYYALAFVRGRGGPILDVLLFPLVTVGVVPTLLRWLVVGPNPGKIVASLLSLTLEPVVLVAFSVLPGVGWFLLILAVWSARLDEHQRQEWEQQHLTVRFREEFLDTDE